MKKGRQIVPGPDSTKGPEKFQKMRKKFFIMDMFIGWGLFRKFVRHI